MSADPWRKSRGVLSNDGQVRGFYISISEFCTRPNTLLDCAQDHADLGAALNAFSLSESEALAGAIEKTGQAIDTTYMSTTKLVRFFLNTFIKVGD